MKKLGLPHTELKDFFTAERGDELRLDYAMVSVVVKSIFSVGKYRASVNILNIAVESQIHDVHRANSLTLSSYWRA